MRLAVRILTDHVFVAAIGFPIIIMLLVPIRTLIIPRLPFTPEELSILDGPTASEFVSLVDYIVREHTLIQNNQTMESVGGTR